MLEEAHQKIVEREEQKFMNIRNQLVTIEEKVKAYQKMIEV